MRGKPGDVSPGVEIRAGTGLAARRRARRVRPAASFDLVVMWGNVAEVEGAILLSPGLRRATDADLDAWAASGRPLVVLVPEFDDYLRPDEARARFARVPQAQLIAVEKAKHLWVGETYVRIVLNEIVRLLTPAAWPLPEQWPAPPPQSGDTAPPPQSGGGKERS